MCNRNLGHALDEVGVAIIGSHVLRREPRRNGRCLCPAGGIDFVSAKVHEVVLEHTGRRLARRGRHTSRALLQQVLNQLKRRVVGHIERLKAAGGRADLRVPRAPGASVCRGDTGHARG